MFSAAANEGGPAMATRSRRRQRPLSSESLVQQPKAKRQRLPLTEQTFLNPDAPPEMFEVKSDKIAALDMKLDGIENFAVPKKDLQLRAKKPKPGERAAKSDGTTILSSNSAFTVSKLSALPDRIRADWTIPQHGDIFSAMGYGLSLTHTHAILWPYTSTTPSPETFTFTLPYPAKHNSDPLPLGCLVDPSASATEPGLVVVMPMSGKITYWESISSAATLDFIRQQRSGVDDVINGMSSGERVVQMVNAESSGFILAMSSGRLAYMNVRDSHGRPSISTQFLRTNLGAHMSGIFGSIRHALGNAASRGDIAAVRVERSSRVGERVVVGTTMKGRFQAWRVHRGGHHDVIADVDMKESIVSSILEVDVAAQEFSPDSFEVLDFAFVPKGLDQRYKDMSKLSNAMLSENGSEQQLLVLASLTDKRASRYSLVEIIVSKERATVGMVRPITSYTTRFVQPPSSSALRPRVYLPRPGLVAFLVFNRAVVVTSIAVPPESPDTQLQADSHILPSLYEDVVDLRSDVNLEIVGSGFEEPYTLTGQGSEENRVHRFKAKNPSVVLLVSGAGVLRIMTTDTERFGSEQPPRVTAKSKLEQAVFFGSKPDNPLVFDGRRERQFSHKELAQAAIQLSNEVLSSSSPHMGTLPVSLEENLNGRLKLLERLMHHLKTTKVELDRTTRWLLLWNAEKMAVALMLWKRHESFTTDRTASDKRSIVADIVEFIHEDQKKDIDASAGELDRVRHWFINDVWRLDIFVAWAYEVIKYMYKDKILDDVRITRLLYEAIQVNVASLGTAYDYRKAHLMAYGLEDEPMDMDMKILRTGYEGLGEPWTGSYFISNNAKRLVELGDQWLDQYYQTKSTAPSQRPDPKLLEKMVLDMPALLDVYLSSILEQARWGEMSDDPAKVQWAQRCRKTFDADRKEKPLWLAKRSQWREGIRITVKYRCWNALAVLVLDHIDVLRKAAEDGETSALDAQQYSAEAQQAEKEIKTFFDKYGEPFAFELYNQMLEKHGFQSILDFEGDQHGYKTKFLRAKPELARISWINDIEKEKDIDHAAETLLDLGLMRELKVWNKKIELSLGKLALMADAESGAESSIFAVARKQTSDQTDVKHEAKLEKIDKELEVIRIQDDLYTQVLATVEAAIDETAEMEIAMQTHSVNIPKKQRALLQVFEDCLKRLVHHEALEAMSLIDLLTLIWLRPESQDEIADPFYLALCVADCSLEGNDKQQARRLIWRRCFIRDDWSRINDTQLKNDDELADTLYDTSLFSTLSACYAKHTSADEPFRPMAPSEAQGVYVDGVDKRFKDMEKAFQDKLVEAMKWEDTMLKKYMDKNRLQEWVRTTAKMADQAVRQMADEATRAGANEEEVEQQLASKRNLRSNGAAV